MKRMSPLPLRPLNAEEHPDAMNAVRPCAAGFKAESHQWVNSDRCVWVLPVLRFRVLPEFCMGASRYFWSGGCDATGPPIEEVRPTQVCEAASDGEQSGGPLSACRTLPLSIQGKWDAPVLLRALDGPLTSVVSHSPPLRFLDILTVSRLLADERRLP